jgi:hypothetical protein
LIKEKEKKGEKRKRKKLGATFIANSRKEGRKSSSK